MGALWGPRQALQHFLMKIARTPYHHLTGLTGTQMGRVQDSNGVENMVAFKLSISTMAALVGKQFFFSSSSYFLLF